jgi:hypothetical protein
MANGNSPCSVCTAILSSTKAPSTCLKTEETTGQLRVSKGNGNKNEQKVNGARLFTRKANTCDIILLGSSDDHV